MKIHSFLSVSLLLLGGMLIASPVVAQTRTAANEAAQKVGLATKAVCALYVDEVDEAKLAEAAIRGLLKDLDPHSAYMTPEEVKELQEPLEGNFDGVGIQFNMLTDTLYVLQTIAGGPSEKVGILAGDRIVAINDTVVAGVKMSNKDIMKRLRGPRGTTVEVDVLRRGTPKLITFRIKRDQIPINSVDAFYMIDKETGYIKLSRFAATSPAEFEKALFALRKQGIRNLVLDLQGNGGGYLNAAFVLADEFLKEDKLIVYTEGNRSPRRDMVATKGGMYQKGRVAVLVDEGSASAAEILSGALQDWDRAVVIGRRTFGKGLVQRPIPLPDGSMMRLTVSRYYTPSGRSIQRPYDKGRDAYDLDLMARYNHGELQHADSIHFPDSLRFKTLQSGRTVYGGGGIMPDIFIPLDTTRYSDYHRDLVAKGVFNTFAMRFIDNERVALKKRFKKFEKFNAGYEIPDAALAELAAAGVADSIPVDTAALKLSAPLMKVQIKALVARELFGESSYYQVINVLNDACTEAVEVLHNEARYETILGLRPRQELVDMRKEMRAEGDASSKQAKQ